MQFKFLGMNSSVVLMYHDIVTRDDKSSGFQNDSAFPYKVEESVFEEQVKALQGKDVIFTFDDGGESFYSKAAPILEKYGFRGVFFISTKYIGTPGFLTAGQVKELAERGHIIGSHSHTHPKVFSDLKPNDIKEEWNKSYAILNSILGETNLTASLPNGCSSKEVLNYAFAAGFTEVYTSEPTVKIRQINNKKVIGRYVVMELTSTQKVVKIVTSKTTRLKLYVKWKLVVLVRTILGPLYGVLKAKLLSH